jgi:DNA helicase HerA-like ATPase
LRVGVNFVEAKVSFNNKNLYTPVRNNEKVYLANIDEITAALGLNNIANPFICGYLKMYEGTEDEITLPVNLNSKFILGSEGAHLNISGISGLAAKTSYIMFLMKSIQERFSNKSDDESVAFVVFNVKGKDLMAIDKENDFSLDDDKNAKETTYKNYQDLGLSIRPFQNVKYYIPYCGSNSSKQSTYLSKDDTDDYLSNSKLKKYKYVYGDDKENIEMMFSNIDDPAQTMESIISKIIDVDDSDFGKLQTWKEFMDKVTEKSQKGSSEAKGDISILSWRKFKRIVRKSIQDDMFANRVDSSKNECRLAEELKTIAANEVRVIDIAKLPEDKQAFVFGDVIRTIYNLRLGEYDAELDQSPPSKIIIFIDELNKYASKDIPKTSPILHELLEVTERGRSLGIVLFAAEQFRSAIHDRVKGNCSTQAYGRTNTIETATADYKSLPKTYKNMLAMLEQGEYLIQNPMFRSLLKIRFPKPIYKQFK